MFSVVVSLIKKIIPVGGTRSLVVFSAGCIPIISPFTNSYCMQVMCRSKVVKISCGKSSPPLASLLAAEYAKPDVAVVVEWGQDSALAVKSVRGNDEIDHPNFTNSASICRLIARLGRNLYGSTVLESTEVDHWLTFSQNLTKSASNSNQLQQLLKYLDHSLSSTTFLVGHEISIADFCVWEAIYNSQQALENTANCRRWFQFLAAQKQWNSVLSELPPEALRKVEEKKPKEQNNMSKDEGKFVDLPGAEKGKVVVRFPPEASGYLHIGHAKAALLNQHYQISFDGKLIMRFDDTNPAKEKEDYEKVILEDVETLQIKPDTFTYTSDHFETMIVKCEEMLNSEKAYVDDTDPEVMKSEREQRQESANRNNSLEKNLTMWDEMKRGTEYGKKCCVRAKIDMKSDNGCMRDPTLYRCKNEHHPRTGSKFNVYPTYDFACPIVDSVEGITHALRTTEYLDRDPQYYWIIDALKLRKPYIWSYSRLNMMNTVLSKRKLTWFVENGIADGWDDPRMPTVRGVLRQGMTVEGLKQFIVAQGSSKSTVIMDWDKIWAFNKKIIDPVAPRYNAIETQGAVKVFVKGIEEHSLTVQKHPKNSEIGTKSVWVGPELLIDLVDAECLKEGENATFINWGNLLIRKIQRNNSGIIESVDAEPNLENKEFKKTLKLTWLANTNKALPIMCKFLYLDHIISKPVLEKDDDFKNFIAGNTKVVVDMLADPELAKLKKSDIIQIQRKGFFICDEPYDDRTIRHIGKESPLILIAIPDGSKDLTALPKLVQRMKMESAKEQSQNAKGKMSEKSPMEEKLPLSQSLSVEDFDSAIHKQGNKVRKLKEEKSKKEVIDAAVKCLLDLKGEYKKITGKDWKPALMEEKLPLSQSLSREDLDNAIQEKGNKIRKLKEEKAQKEVIDAAVKCLLDLKGEYKKSTGTDWKPKVNVQSLQEAVHTDNTTQSLEDNIVLQGNKIRDLKSSKAGKNILDPEIKELLKLKEKYKTLTGQDWKPGQTTAKPESKAKAFQNKEKISSIVTSSEKATELMGKIDAQGEKLRSMKSSCANKSLVDIQVSALLALKKEYKELTGEDLAKGNSDKKSKKGGEQQQKPQQPTNKTNKNGGNDTKPEASDSDLKKITRLGMEAKKEENLSEWYSQVITKAELIEYYDISGCYILRPGAYAIWESIKEEFDRRIKLLGVQNCYFPMFVSSHALEKEKTHISDFAPEVAWVTRSGNTDLAEPIAIRPTSETVMYPTYAKWIKSHRDLPLQLNQWCNVVRWEFKHPQPFLRTREFLWQEGHTAFATKEEAVNEVYEILSYYADIYEKLLAIPVIRGRKTEKEKFAGGDFTTTVEAFISASGRAIQGATSHHLGQNFSKMFEIIIEDPETSEKKFVYQNSWGLTTRTIGVMVMIHGDNLGLILPPRVACYQVVIVPCGITVNLSEQDKGNLIDKCKEFEKVLTSSGIRCKGDYRDNYSPGWKFNHWELKGVPIRIELGPRDINQGEYVAVRRDSGKKATLKTSNVITEIPQLLEDIQTVLYKRATDDLNKHLTVAHTFNEFCEKLEKKCIIQAPFCGEISCEDQIKDESGKNALEKAEEGAPSMGAKSLCIPFNQPAEIKEGMKCINPVCNNKPMFYTLFGRSY